MDIEMQLKKRIAMISGATGGLGNIATKIFAEYGVKLALISRDNEKLRKLSNTLDLPDENVLLQNVDISEPESALKAVDSTLDYFSQIDIYLHLVGGWVGGNPVTEVMQDDIESMLKQHLWSTFFITKAILPNMLQNGWGRIIVISSPSAYHPPGKNSPYAIAKAAQDALILSLAEEVKGTGVTANIIPVKIIDTEHEKVKNPNKKNQSWTTPEEITNTILHLCSDQAGIINGVRIPLTGSG
jgi:NAD(P)-dependent dehydrogenase (short-subunit alcohol dehydrogenase family)